MLEETLLHKGSAEEWNSVMINEHLPGKPLQHNLILRNLGLYRENSCMGGSKVEGGGDNNACFTSLSTCRIRSSIAYTQTNAATAYIHTRHIHSR
jgi:hypothetical protein